MRNIVEFSNYSFQSKEMFTKHNGMFLILVGDNKNKYYPNEMKEFQSNVFQIYYNAINDPNVVLGHGIYWFHENIKITLSLCIETYKNKQIINFYTLEHTLNHISEMYKSPIFIYWPFVQQFLDLEWFENFLETTELKNNNKFFLTGVLPVKEQVS